MALFLSCEQPSSPGRPLADGVSPGDSSRATIQITRDAPRPNLDVSASAVSYTASPSLHQSAFPGRVQTEPVTITFTSPVGSVAISGSGAISCSGDYGILEAYGAEGQLVDRKLMTLIDQSDCGADNVTHGAHGTVSSAEGIIRIVIAPMSPMSFPVFNLTGYATAYYSVRILAQHVGAQASCSSPTPVRGTPTSCSVAVTGGVEFTVLERRAKGKAFEIVEYPNVTVSANQRHEWGGGEAVAKTEVRFKVRYIASGKSQERTVSAKYDVQQRSWNPFTLVNAPDHVRGLAGRMQEYPENGVLGVFGFDGPALNNTGKISTVQSGPNRGLSYYNAPITLGGDSYAYTHPGMYANEAGGRQWYDDQNGRGSGTCLQNALPDLASMIEVHEGVTQLPDASHWGIARRVLQNGNIHADFEALYVAGAADKLIGIAGRVWSNWREGPTYRRPQREFDEADIPRMIASIRCTLDFESFPDR